MSCGCSNFVDEEYDEFFGLFDRGRRRRKGGLESSVRRAKKRMMPTKDCDCEECARLKASLTKNPIEMQEIDVLLAPKVKKGLKKLRNRGVYKNFVEGDDFMVTDESTFSFNDNSQLMDFDGGGQMMDFGVDDVENGDEAYDNFLTKKMRERRRVRKELQAGGLSRKEAKQLALEQVPRTTLKELIARLKQGEDVDNAGGVDLTGLSESEKADLLNQALRGSGVVSQREDATRNIDLDADDDADKNKAGFFEENKTALMLVGLGALAVVGYFAFGKKLGIRK